MKGFLTVFSNCLTSGFNKSGEWSCAETKSLLQGQVARNSRAVSWKLSRRAQLCPNSFSLLVREQPAGIRTSYKSTTKGAKDGWDCGLRPPFPCHHGAFPSTDSIYGVHANKDWSFRGKWSNKMLLYNIFTLIPVIRQRCMMCKMYEHIYLL